MGFYQDAYNDYLAKTGAGVDSAGRFTVNPSIAQGDPRAFDYYKQAKMQAEAAAMQEETEEQARHRMIMDRLTQYSPPGGYRGQVGG